VHVCVRTCGNSIAMMFGAVYYPGLLYLGAMGLVIYVSPSLLRFNNVSFRRFVRICPPLSRTPQRLSRWR
jgi:TRAP-type C4-dicarboxylate transport system permease large subunit